MSTPNTGQQGADSETGRMGVASLPSKRRLEASSANAEYPNSPKQAKKSSLLDSDPNDSIFSSGLEKCSSEFLTTSILARTLLTSSSPALTPCNNGLSSSPLESLKSSLEALPTPMFLESLEELQCSSPLFCSLPKALRSDERTDLEFNSLLSGDATLSTVTVLSPIDQTSAEWDATGILPLKNANPVPMSNDQLITEDENGKSYFNLGPSEATVLAKKSSKGSPGNSPPDQTWTSNGNSLDYLDESSSSSSCESISSEDLFNSCEEFDEASEDEAEVRSYKQQRSTVLHLSLCKLNSFRNQCAEPSLHRSVLICNTLRHIEQEIRQEDEVKKRESNFLQSRETLPSFWSANSRNAAPLPVTSNGQVSHPVLPPTLSNAAAATPTLGHDPYLSSSPYNDSPYSTVSSPAAYDYNSPLRPQQTPFHTPSYDYAEADLSNSAAHSHQSPSLMGFSPSPVPSLLECDSGYGEDTDLSMSNYYYAPSPPLNPIKASSRDSAPDNCYLACNSESTNTYSCSVSTTQAELHLSMTRKDGGTHFDTKDKDKVSCSLVSNNNLEDASGGPSDNAESWSKFSSSPSQPTSAAISSFAQQESQCGMESLRSDLFLGSTNGHSIHYQLPMDSLISPNYSAT